MPNKFWQLSADEALVLLADHQGSNLDFRDHLEAKNPEWLFIHLTGNHWEVFVDLREKGRNAVDMILAHNAIVDRILGFLKTGDYYTAKAITAQMWLPYAEKHIQAILDVQIKLGKIKSMPGPEGAHYYTIAVKYN